LITGNTSLRQLAIPHNEFTDFGAQQFRTYLRQKIIKDEFFCAENQNKIIDKIMQFYFAYDRPEGEPNNWFYLERIMHVGFIQFRQFII
jgi:hypothetical protein